MVADRVRGRDTGRAGAMRTSAGVDYHQTVESRLATSSTGSV